MKTLKQLERLRKANKLIKQQKTGTPAEFAIRLHISVRELYRLLEYLKEMDATICFSRNSNTYYYKEDFDILVHINIQVLVKEEIKTIYAGSNLLRRNFERMQFNLSTAMLWQ